MAPETMYLYTTYARCVINIKQSGMVVGIFGRLQLELLTIIIVYAPSKTGKLHINGLAFTKGKNVTIAIRKSIKNIYL